VEAQRQFVVQVFYVEHCELNGPKMHSECSTWNNKVSRSEITVNTTLSPEPGRNPTCDTLMRTYLPLPQSIWDAKDHSQTSVYHLDYTAKNRPKRSFQTINSTGTSSTNLIFSQLSHKQNAEAALGNWERLGPTEMRQQFYCSLTLGLPNQET
jgi:hypothetical protein